MCEVCKRITEPTKDIFWTFARTHAPGTQEEFQRIENKDSHFCPVCGRSLDLTERDPGWIPVSERLPAVMGDYLVSDAYGHVHVMFCTPHLESPWGISEHDQRFFPVVAWMPLPIPYNEVNKNDD